MSARQLTMKGVPSENKNDVVIRSRLPGGFKGSLIGPESIRRSIMGWALENNTTIRQAAESAAKSGYTLETMGGYWSKAGSSIGSIKAHSDMGGWSSIEICSREATGAEVEVYVPDARSRTKTDVIVPRWVHSIRLRAYGYITAFELYEREYRLYVGLTCDVYKPATFDKQGWVCRDVRW